MLFLLLLAETIAPPAPVTSRVAARATARIERGASTSASDWKGAPDQSRRDVVRKRADGSVERLRIVDLP